MPDLFRGFGAVFYKEVLHVRRDAGTLFFSLTMPLLQLFLLGFGIDTNIRQINTVVYNADGRRESRELLDRLCRQADSPEHQCRFSWSPDAVAFWDNRAVQHYASSDYWPHRRTMERASVVGSRPERNRD